MITFIYRVERTIRQTAIVEVEVIQEEMNNSLHSEIEDKAIAKAEDSLRIWSPAESSYRADLIDRVRT